MNGFKPPNPPPPPTKTKRRKKVVHWPLDLKKSEFFIIQTRGRNYYVMYTHWMKWVGGSWMNDLNHNGCLSKILYPTSFYVNLIIVQLG